MRSCGCSTKYFERSKIKNMKVLVILFIIKLYAQKKKLLIGEKKNVIREMNYHTVPLICYCLNLRLVLFSLDEEVENFVRFEPVNQRPVETRK